MPVRYFAQTIIPGWKRLQSGWRNNEHPAWRRNHRVRSALLPEQSDAERGIHTGALVCWSVRNHLNGNGVRLSISHQWAAAPVFIASLIGTPDGQRVADFRKAAMKTC